MTKLPSVWMHLNSCSPGKQRILKEKIRTLCSPGKCALGSLKHAQKVHQPLPSGKEVNGIQLCSKFQILPNFSRNKHFEEKCQDTENVPDKIFYLIESSKPSLRLTVSLKRRQKHVHFAKICEKHYIFPQYASLFYQISSENVFADIFGSVGQQIGSWHLSFVHHMYTSL